MPRETMTLRERVQLELLKGIQVYHNDELKTIKDVYDYKHDINQISIEFEDGTSMVANYNTDYEWELAGTRMKPKPANGRL